MIMSHNETRERLIASIDHDLDEARSSKSWQAVAALYRLRVQIERLDEERIESEDDTPPIDPLEERLWRVRRMRDEAQAAGSWQAAAALMRQEGDALAALDARRREDERQARLAGDSDAILAEITAILDTLPAALVVELSEAIARRRAQIQ